MQEKQYLKHVAVSVIALFVMLTMLYSCRSIHSAEDDDFSNLGDISLEKIERLLEEGDNLRAIPLIKRKVRMGEDVSALFDHAVAGLKSEWEAARSDGDWRRSLVYLRSFKILGEDEVVEDVTEAQLILDGVRSYLSDEKSGAAAVLVQTEMDLSIVDPEIRKELAEEFRNLGHITVAHLLSGESEPQSPGMEPLVQGTVTVWVNRGIRLVGNVGIPDRGIGSGFFIDSAGYLLTNYHVIESEVDPTYQGYSRLYIKTDDESGERIPAKVVGYDKNLDLALLKTEMDVPYVFSFSGNESPALGEGIFAIGSPGGLTRTLTSGTVSAYARSVQPMAGSLQIDVPINPGNSGGPLLNGNGEVIGVVFAGVQDFEGVNFAIPGEYVKELVPALYDGGQVEIPWLGVAAWDYGGRIEATYVVPGSPAADAGLVAGDVITSVDAIPFRTIKSLQEYLVSSLPATLVSLEWERDGDITEGIAALGVRPDVPLRTALTRDAREHLLTPLFGFTLERISGSGINQNYRVVSVLPGSVADETGFTPGDTFALRKWIHDEEYDVVAIQIVLKGRKAGFLESAVQIASYLDVNTVF